MSVLRQHAAVLVLITGKGRDFGRQNSIANKQEKNIYLELNTLALGTMVLSRLVYTTDRSK